MTKSFKLPQELLPKFGPYPLPSNEMSRDEALAFTAKVKLPYVDIQVGEHFKGEPYPEHDFSKLLKHKVHNEIVVCSNEQLKILLDLAWEQRPEQHSVKYLYYQILEEVKDLQEKE